MLSARPTPPIRASAAAPLVMTPPAAGRLTRRGHGVLDRAGRNVNSGSGGWTGGQRRRNLRCAGPGRSRRSRRAGARGRRGAGAGAGGATRRDGNPPRQRAVLILRDVVSSPAAEVAEPSI